MPTIKHVIYSILAGIILLNTGCGSKLDKAHVRKVIAEADAKWANAMKTASTDDATGFYADNGIVMPPNEPLLEGKKAIRDWYDAFWKTGIKVTNANLETEGIDGEGGMVTEYGYYTMTYQAPGSVSAQTDSGKYLAVWRKQSDGSWKQSLACWNSSLPAYAPSNEAVPQKPKAVKK